MTVGAPSHAKRSPRGAACLLVLALLLASMVPSSSTRAAPMYGDAPSPEHVYDQIDVLDQWYRYLDSPGHRNAEAHIVSVFEDYGLNTTVQEYTAQRLDGSVRAANVLGLLEGNDTTRCLVIGGHYDNNQRSSKGAYDNAVGVGTVIELARLFTQVHEDVPPVSMLFAAWDSEEGGGAGSRHFLDDPVWDVEIVGYINLDMYGLSWPVRNTIPMADEEFFKLNVYTSPVSDFSIYDEEYTDETLENFTAFRDTLERIAYDDHDYPERWVIVMDDTAGISDHRFFVLRSIPAVWFRGMNEKPREEGDLNEIAFKHTPADTLETMVRYADGKPNLLRGIDTGLTLAYDLAIEWMWHVESMTDEPGTVDQVDDGRSGIGTSGGAVIGISLLVLLLVPVVFIVWRRRRRGNFYLEPS